MQKRENAKVFTLFYGVFTLVFKGFRFFLARNSFKYLGHLDNALQSLYLSGFQTVQEKRFTWTLGQVSWTGSKIEISEPL